MELSSWHCIVPIHKGIIIKETVNFSLRSGNVNSAYNLCIEFSITCTYVFTTSKGVTIDFVTIALAPEENIRFMRGTFFLSSDIAKEEIN